jgi:hypothetical protein
MTANASTPRTDRVAERRRAVALARHFRESEGLSIAAIGREKSRAAARTCSVETEVSALTVRLSDGSERLTAPSCGIS